jgi:hypothetical protein
MRDHNLEPVVEVEGAGRAELDAYPAALAELANDSVPMTFGCDRRNRLLQKELLHAFLGREWPGNSGSADGLLFIGSNMNSSAADLTVNL